MHPTLRSLVETTKAMEQYNEHARTQTRRLDEIKHNLDDEDRAKEKQPTAVRKLTRLGRVKSGALLRTKPMPKPNLSLATEAPRQPGHQDSFKQLIKLRTRRGKSTTLQIQHKSNTEPVKVVRFSVPRSMQQQQQRPANSLMGPPPRPPPPLWHLPSQSITSPSHTSPIATTPLNPAKRVLTAATKGPLAGGSIVDRSRDPRLRGRLGT